eukprot:COSAG02_NODE_2806_length_7991_cov_21.891916_8_plen_49_part_00
MDFRCSRTKMAATADERYLQTLLIGVSCTCATMCYFSLVPRLAVSMNG